MYMFLLNALKTFFALSTCLLKKLCPETCQLKNTSMYILRLLLTGSAEALHGA